MKVLFARFNRWSYLLFKGMWRGESGADIYGSNGYNLLTGTGSFIEGTWKTTHVFYGKDVSKKINHP